MTQIISQFFLMIMILSLVNMLYCAIKVRKIIKENKDNPNVKGITIVNGEISIIEETPQENPFEETVKVICCKVQKPVGVYEEDDTVRLETGSTHILYLPRSTDTRVKKRLVKVQVLIECLYSNQSNKVQVVKCTQSIEVKRTFLCKAD